MLRMLCIVGLLTAVNSFTAGRNKLRLETAASEKRSILDLHERPGEPTKTHSCNHVRAVPESVRKEMRLGLSDFYQQYTEAYGIPVLASNKVSKDAIKRACYVTRFLFADNSKIRRTVYKVSGKILLFAMNRCYSNSFTAKLFLDFSFYSLFCKFRLSIIQ